MGETYALELKDISKRFGSVQANDHVNLTLRKSEILAILGENGSGKTTLMNMIYGIYYPDEGHIFVNGNNLFAEGFLRTWNRYGTSAFQTGRCTDSSRKYRPGSAGQGKTQYEKDHRGYPETGQQVRI